jgi:hypothetical protein
MVKREVAIASAGGPSHGKGMVQDIKSAMHTSPWM